MLKLLTMLEARSRLNSLEPAVTRLRTVLLTHCLILPDEYQQQTLPISDKNFTNCGSVYTENRRYFDTKISGQNHLAEFIHYSLEIFLALNFIPNFSNEIWLAFIVNLTVFGETYEKRKPRQIRSLPQLLLEIVLAKKQAFINIFCIGGSTK